MQSKKKEKRYSKSVPYLILQLCDQISVFIRTVFKIELLLSHILLYCCSLRAWNHFSFLISN